MTDNRMKSIYQKRTRIGDNILKVLIYLAAGVAIALLVGIMGYVFVRGLPQVSWQLLSTVQSSLKGTFGILGNIINTIYIIVITLIIAAPIGIGTNTQSRENWCGRLNLQPRSCPVFRRLFLACSVWSFSE